MSSNRYLVHAFPSYTIVCPPRKWTTSSVVQKLDRYVKKYLMQPVSPLNPTIIVLHSAVELCIHTSSFDIFQAYAYLWYTI